MATQVVTRYPELWHYTNAGGLQGILQSQQLWATNIFHLNDSEEFSGFFDRSLPHLVKKGVLAGVVSLGKSQEGAVNIKAEGGTTGAVDFFVNALLDRIRTVTSDLPVYVTSFCGPPPASEVDDGLLSQWRGYGGNGGYALVFDSDRLDKLLRSEQEKYSYSFGQLCDVDYHTAEVATAAQHIDTAELAEALSLEIERLVATSADDLTVAIVGLLIRLATRHKHRGFREESEVRFAAWVTTDDDVIERACKDGELRLKKPIHFVQRDGILVPHISLFAQPENGKVTLPITKIVVGPHPTKFKRQKAVQMLLDELKIDAEVVVSDIPYLG